MTMKATTLLLVGTALLLVVGPAPAQDAKKLIVGKWEAIQKGPDNEDIKVTAQFHADGKLEMEIRTVKITGKYTFTKDDEIETETTFEKKTTRIKQGVKVTQDTLELKDPSGQVFKFKRIK